MREAETQEPDGELPLGDEEGQEVGAARRLAEEPGLPLELVLQEQASPLSGVYHLLELPTAPGCCEVGCEMGPRGGGWLPAGWRVCATKRLPDHTRREACLEVGREGTSSDSRCRLARALTPR